MRNLTISLSIKQASKISLNGSARAMLQRKRYLRRMKNPKVGYFSVIRITRIAADLGLDWLDKLVEQSKREPIFEDEAPWNQILAELGRITVHFDALSFNLKGLLVTLERPQDLTMDTSAYARVGIKKLIRKCREALDNLQASIVGKHEKLFRDCRAQLEQCNEVREKRNELIHALWSPSAFPPHITTRLGMIETKVGTFETSK
jgi:hypothetical protein